MTFKTWSLCSLSSLTLIFGLALAGSAAAETACKGMSQSKCEASDSCAWVGGYTTGKGVKVSSYCRSKSSQSSKSTSSSSSKSSKSTSSSSSKKSDSKKTSDSKKKTEAKDKSSKSSS